jgi:outer membrane protein
VIFLLLLVSSSALFAQQLTRFAVVDLSRVYTSFFKESRAVRDFEEKSSRVQSDIDRMTQEIQSLKSQQVDAQMQGDIQCSLKLENDIYKKSEFLKDYYTTKTNELEDQKRRLAQDNAFLGQVQTEIQLVAESEGYSMVLSLKDNPGILWYSPSVDITDKVIQSLLTKAGR